MSKILICLLKIFWTCDAPAIQKILCSTLKFSFVFYPISLGMWSPTSRATRPTCWTSGLSTRCFSSDQGSLFPAAGVGFVVDGLSWRSRARKFSRLALVMPTNISYLASNHKALKGLNDVCCWGVLRGAFFFFCPPVLLIVEHPDTILLKRVFLSCYQSTSFKSFITFIFKILLQFFSPLCFFGFCKNPCLFFFVSFPHNVGTFLEDYHRAHRPRPSWKAMDRGKWLVIIWV